MKKSEDNLKNPIRNKFWEKMMDRYEMQKATKEYNSMELLRTERPGDYGC